MRNQYEGGKYDLVFYSDFANGFLSAIRPVVTCRLVSLLSAPVGDGRNRKKAHIPIRMIPALSSRGYDVTL